MTFWVAIARPRMLEIVPCRCEEAGQSARAVAGGSSGICLGLLTLCRLLAVHHSRKCAGGSAKNAVSEGQYCGATGRFAKAAQPGRLPPSKGGRMHRRESSSETRRGGGGGERRRKGNGRNDTVKQEWQTAVRSTYLALEKKAISVGEIESVAVVRCCRLASLPTEPTEPGACVVGFEVLVQQRMDWLRMADGRWQIADGGLWCGLGVGFWWLWVGAVQVLSVLGDWYLGKVPSMARWPAGGLAGSLSISLHILPGAGRRGRRRAAGLPLCSVLHCTELHRGACRALRRW